jgi:hypothetical protein
MNLQGKLITFLVENFSYISMLFFSKILSINCYHGWITSWVAIGRCWVFPILSTGNILALMGITSQSYDLV